MLGNRISLAVSRRQKGDSCGVRTRHGCDTAVDLSLRTTKGPEVRFEKVWRRGRISNSALCTNPLRRNRLLCLAVRGAAGKETTELLPEAAEDLLRIQGVEATTLRAIAQRAGVSVGIVYRRFRDKDSVLRAVYTQFFARIRAGNQRALGRSALQSASRTQLLTAIISGIAKGYRRNRDLLRALVLYARTHPDSRFRRGARELNALVYADVRDLLLRSTEGIQRPDPDSTVAFALSAAASVLQERILFADVTALPLMSDGELITETTRMIERYLSVR